MEPFAAVKKLMGQHFDAVVVDCDNEQNATLLFKSARNSTSNQASLAVAVVEGQAGVAKAFRIGANLVLTKPINIEQAKGTLRVARGLLRKGEPAKPASIAPPAPAPPKPVAAKPVPPLKSGVPFTPAAVPTSLPVAPPAIKPAATSASWPAAAAASVAPTSTDGDLTNLGVGAPIPASSAAAIVESAFSDVKIPDLPLPKLPTTTVPSAAAEAKIVSHAGLSAMSAGGAASAAAPAREVQDPRVSEVAPLRAPAEAESVSTHPAEAVKRESSSYVGSEPSFTFGGANVAEKSSGGSKKILLGVAAAVLVAAALYFGWTKFHGTASQQGNTQTQTAPSVPVPESVKPSSSQAVPATAKPSASAPTTATSIPNSQPDAVAAKSPTPAATNNVSDDDVPAPSTTRTSGAASPATSKPAEAPLMVKGGTAPVVHAKPAGADAPAPDMSAIATAGAGAPPPNLGSGAGTELHPVLQTLHISQGVSQGLLMKKVQPVYPRNAIFMRLEGSVELMATISKTGDISHVKVLSGDSQLTRAAADAVKQWKYKPYLLNGEPVEIQTQVTVNFKLPK